MPNASQTVAWLMVMPALAAWPFFSAFPLFSLLDGTGGTVASAAQTVMLVTGFWGCATLYVCFRLLTATARRPTRALFTGLGLKVGVYALAWTCVYGLVMYVTS